MKRVLLQGTFDIIHYGHILTFQYAKRQGDELLLALNTNRLVKEYKGKNAIDTWEHKKRVLESIKYIDKVIPADNVSPLGLLKQYDVDVFVVGSEFADKHPDCVEYMESKGGKVIISPRWKGGMSTSKIKEILLDEAIKNGA